ncbi:MAG: GNAT family N-acetyltransferase [Anaerolineales bacterium]|nr:GNAT family N-acetyltransferase [Anaerolineales bacterium]
MTPIRIRPVHPDDAVQLHAIVSDPRVARTLVQLPSMELAETLAWMERRTPGYHRLVAEHDGRILGAANLRQAQNPRMRHSGRIGLFVHADHWRQGVGAALLTALIDLADNWLNLRRLQLEVFTDHAAAIRLYERFGFAAEGVARRAVFGSGRFHDELLMARLHRPELLPPAAQPPAAPPPRPPRRNLAITIRPMLPDDVAAWHALRREPAVARTTAQLPSLELLRARQQAESGSPHMHRLMAVVHEAGGPEAGEDRVVGSCHLHHHDNPRLAHTANLGMHVHPDYWGQGIGGRLLAAALDLADNWLDLQRVHLEVNTDNPPAIRLYEKYGFEIEGTHRYHIYGDGRWADSHFMGRLRPSAGE